MSALNERIQYKGSSSRPAMDGWVEKGGKFSLALTTTVAGRFSRTTRLRGIVKQEDKVTVIRGTVPDGVDQQGLIMVVAGVAIATVVMLLNGRPILSIVTIIIGAAMCIPLIGDNRNSEVLMQDLEKTLKAKATPPRKK